MSLPPALRHLVALIALAAGLLGAASAGNDKASPDVAGMSATPRPAAPQPAPGTGFRGVHFNPQVHADPGFPWLIFYSQYRAQVRAALQDLAQTARINLVAIFVPIPNTLLHGAQGNQVGQALGEWASTAYLDNVAAFIDDCSAVGIAVELDLADNRWVPYTVDSAHHIGKPGDPWWPVADADPWNEAAAWYTQIIAYVEAKTAHPESIAMWCMMGNYTFGTAEPVLWDTDGMPDVRSYTEQFVKNVWPAFRAAGRRPKAAPILLPIFANDPYWMERSPEARLSAFTNTRKWIVDDLALPPDYWLFTAYPCCEPATDGVYYLRKIVDILGRENASRIVATDLQGPGQSQKNTIIDTAGLSGPALLRWHFKKCAEYGLCGWWMWSYQDTPNDQRGLRQANGEWKTDLLQAITEQAPHD